MATAPASAVTTAVTTAAPHAAAPAVATAKSTRIAAIDWMRGLVMVLMVIDHASMAFDGTHLDDDSAMYPGAATMALPGGEFFTRWITHICAPTFVFLAGVALALSVERRVAKGTNAWEIDKSILARGALIALLDPTIISLGSGRWTLQVLLAIGLSMICMVPLRRLPSWLLLAFGLGWIVLGEFPTDWVWDPPGASSPLSALFVGTYGADNLVIKYPLLPWLSMMVLGWVLGRHMLEFSSGKARVSPQTVLWIAGAVALAVFVGVRASQGYGDMFLPRTGDTWQQWLHVSKYPPSLTYATLELGLLSWSLAFLMAIEPYIGVRKNGVFLVFGQTSMFFYLVHRLAFEIPATYFGLRSFGNLSTTYLVAFAMLVLLYPACRWYRTFKAAHPQSILKYF